MYKMRKEWMLLSVGLLVIAGVILYTTMYAPDLDVLSVPQTAPTSALTAEKSRYAVHINEATREELLGVKYITESLADAILTWREENGMFLSETELLDVPGIGEKTLERIRPYILID